MLVRKPKMVLIDVDGTLVDSVPDLAYCVDRMMEHMGRTVWGESRVRDWVGNGVERLVRRALTGTLDGEPDEESFKQAYPCFLDLYAENTSKRSCLYPGAREGLDQLAARGYALGCVTNKAACFTEPLLRNLDIDDKFSVVISGDTLARKKPDPAQLLYAAEYFGVKPEDALMVGDSVNDVQAARAAGFQVVCVSYGYNHGQDIRDANPDMVIDSLVDLDAIMEQAA